MRCKNLKKNYTKNLVGIELVRMAQTKPTSVGNLTLAPYCLNRLNATEQIGARVRACILPSYQRYIGMFLMIRRIRTADVVAEVDWSDPGYGSLANTFLVTGTSLTLSLTDC